MSDTTDPGGATHVGIPYEEDGELPLSSHPPRKRLSREPPAVGHGDRCNDNQERDSTWTP
jgi:hypothetical protein